MPKEKKTSLSQKWRLKKHKKRLSSTKSEKTSKTAPFFYTKIVIISWIITLNLQNSTVFIQNSCYLSEKIIKIDNTIL